MVIKDQLPQRKSTRLIGYDYSSNGAYFVTLVAKNRNCPFGTISNGIIDATFTGKLIIDSWQQLPINYPYVELDAYCLMPDHFHGILFILKNDQPNTTIIDMTVNQATAKIKPLGQLIGVFKTISTKQINLARNTPGEIVWQRNFHDHIIRNENDLDRIREYIMTNPSRWPK